MRDAFLYTFWFVATCNRDTNLYLCECERDSNTIWHKLNETCKYFEGCNMGLFLFYRNLFECEKGKFSLNLRERGIFSFFLDFSMNWKWWMLNPWHSILFSLFGVVPFDLTSTFLVFLLGKAEKRKFSKMEMFQGERQTTLLS